MITNATRQGSVTLTALTVFTTLCILIIAADLWSNVQSGGDPWKQADWLVNDINQQVRRGAFGSALIWVSDTVGVSPLTPVYAVQFAALLVLSGALLIVFRHIEAQTALVLFVFSPAFLIIFWAADPGGSLRKELIGYTAIALLLLVPIYPTAKRALTFASLAVFGAACIGHEINVLLAPTYVLVFLLCLRPERLTIVAMLFALAALCGGAMLYSMTHTMVADHTTVCTPLTDRGVDPDFCIGAIKWMEKDTAFGREQIELTFMSLGNLARFLMSYGIVAAPFLYLVTRTDSPKLVLAAALLSMMPFLPLYGVAVDWGRWMNLHVMSFAFVFFAATLTGFVKIIRPLNSIVLVLVVLVGLFWKQPHAGTPIPGGLVFELIGLSAAF